MLPDELQDTSELRRRANASTAAGELEESASCPHPSAGDSFSSQLAQARAEMARKVEQQQHADGWTFHSEPGEDKSEQNHAEAGEAEGSGMGHRRRASTMSLPSEDEDDYVQQLLRPNQPSSAAPSTDPIPEEADTTTTAPSEDAPTCRICFAGADEEESGKLFSPCLCSGTTRYVHQGCLDQWRKVSRNQSAFYRCDLCKYRYRFRRTAVAAIVTSKITVTLLTTWIFFLLVFISGFVANSLISVVEARRAVVSNSIFDELFVADHILLGEGVREAVEFVNHQLEDSRWVAGTTSSKESDDLVPEQDEDGELTIYHYANPSRAKRYHRVSAKPVLPPFLLRAVMHSVKGVSLIGVLSSFYAYAAATFMSPLGRTLFRAVRPAGARRNNTANGASMSQLVVIVLVIFGIIRSVRTVYRGVKWGTKQVLSRVEDLVLDVGGA
ncbi:hypothetical protein JCM8097_003316 [Rhodosporidiobolus ruineniae]